MSFAGTAARALCAAALLAASAYAASAQTLTLREALARALAVSPRLSAADRDIGIASGQRLQAGALLNP
ncbi:MAG: TolC family protein, partial [Bradyrhizobium sp.]|nr:TolC family protein [Bradyrhizobium sp.]